MEQAFATLCPVCKKEWYTKQGWSTWSRGYVASEEMRPQQVCPECSGGKKARDFKDLTEDERRANDWAVQKGRDLSEAAFAARREEKAREEALRQEIPMDNGIPVRCDFVQDPGRVTGWCRTHNTKWPCRFLEMRGLAKWAPTIVEPLPKFLDMGDAVVATVPLGPTPEWTRGRLIGPTEPLGQTPAGTRGRVIGQFELTPYHYLQVAFEGGEIFQFLDEARSVDDTGWLARVRDEGSVGSRVLAPSGLPAPDCGPREREGSFQIRDVVVLRKDLRRKRAGLPPGQQEYEGPPAGTRGRVISVRWTDGYRLRSVKVKFDDGSTEIFVDASTEKPNDTSSLELLRRES